MGVPFREAAIPTQTGPLRRSANHMSTRTRSGWTLPKAAPSSWKGSSSARVAQPAGPRHSSGAQLATAAARQTTIQPARTAALGR